MEPIFLIGFMGAGKTTVGIALSEKVNLPVIDADKYLEEKQGKKINEIFEESGEEFFRSLETEVLKELSGKENTIITTGGGVVGKRENRELLKESGTVIYLSCLFESLWERLKQDQTRPLVSQNNKKQLHELFQERASLYESCSDIIINTEKKKVEQVIKDILVLFSDTKS
jgi:shikimate kinase